MSKDTSAQKLDGGQYSHDGLETYQLVFGPDFVSPGGAKAARGFIAELNLETGSRVLDVCCGLGGSAFLMAQEFGLQVDGVDLSYNMVEHAQRRATELGVGDRVRFHWGDCLELDRPQQYDAIYSRDAFMHIADKARLFAVLHRCLKPGGRLLITDYGCSQPPWSKAFSDYVEQRSYYLHTATEYKTYLEQAGFDNVRSVDLTSRFQEILADELELVAQLEVDPLLKEALKTSWEAKLNRAKLGEQRWGLFVASGPVTQRENPHIQEHE
jgi:phosphoethanolamine N-methyltransferase